MPGSIAQNWSQLGKRTFIFLVLIGDVLEKNEHLGSN